MLRSKTEPRDPQRPHDPNGTTKVLVTIPNSLVAMADRLARANYMTRSEIIRTALTSYVRHPYNVESMATPFMQYDQELIWFMQDFAKARRKRQLQDEADQAAARAKDAPEPLDPDLDLL